MYLFFFAVILMFSYVSLFFMFYCFIVLLFWCLYVLYIFISFISRYTSAFLLPCSASFSHEGPTESETLVRWEVSDCELEVALRSCNRTSCFYEEGHWGVGNTERGSKIQPRWSGFPGGLIPSFLNRSHSWVIGAGLQGNCQFIKWSHITNSDIQNSSVFVGPKGSPPLNWTLYLLSNRVVKIYEQTFGLGRTVSTKLCQ